MSASGCSCADPSCLWSELVLMYVSCPHHHHLHSHHLSFLLQQETESGWRNQPDSETKQNEKRGEIIGERSPKTRDLSRTASINWSVRFLKLFSFEYKWIAHVIPFYICKNAVLQPTHDQVRPRERQPWWRGDTVHLPPWKNTQINCLEHFQGKVLPYRLLRYPPILSLSL